ncbi:MAG TPA: FHA domain-containing protein [Thermoanaerobaculaceae bacterium]|nr:FHA domain-containing protein [Thermoanaerobaculaceae bacterium]
MPQPKGCAMIVSCPSCKAKYQYEESRFGESGSKKLRCTKCSTVFEVTKPLLAGADASPTAVVPAQGTEKTGQDKAGGKFVALEEESGLAELAPLAAHKRYSLAVIMGANAGQIYTVGKPRTVLGRGTESDVQLQDSEVSRRHAMLEIRGDEATLIDLGSTNGSYVDGVRVQKAAIFSNQEFSLGTTTLMFIVTDMHDASVDG